MVDGVPQRKSFKSIIRKWIRLAKKSSSKQPQVNEDPHPQTETQHQADDNDDQVVGRSLHKRRSMSEVRRLRINGDSVRFNTSPTDIGKNGCFPSVATFSRNASRKHSTCTPFSRSGTKRRGRKSSETVSNLSSCKTVNNSRTFSKAYSSRKSTSSCIMFSNSSGMLKPLALEKNLECSLEELCHGCKKQISVTRDVLFSDGHIDEKEEVLTIDVQPGWTKGTKVIFEGKEDERYSGLPADIIFIVAEKSHPSFRREGDDLELTLEIPLSKALTGGELSVPLLGEENMALDIDDVIFPGFEKIVTGKGMPTSTEQGKRGNLKLRFLVEFPTELTDKQRSEVVSILQDSSEQ